MKEKEIKLFIGNVIKNKRIECGIRQEDVAQALKLTRVSVLNIEAGRHAPTLESIFILCATE